MTGYIGQSKHSEKSLCVATSSRNATAICPMCADDQGTHCYKEKYSLTEGSREHVGRCVKKEKCEIVSHLTAITHMRNKNAQAQQHCDLTIAAYTNTLLWRFPYAGGKVLLTRTLWSDPVVIKSFLGSVRHHLYTQLQNEHINLCRYRTKRNKQKNFLWLHLTSK